MRKGGQGRTGGPRGGESVEGTTRISPLIQGVGVGGVGPRNRSTPLSKISLPILETAGDLGGLACLALCLGGGLETLDLFQATIVARGDQAGAFLVTRVVLG